MTSRQSKDRKNASWIPQGLMDAARNRTADVITKVRRAMQEMARDIEQHEGLYPYNGGRVDQSEVCRRAGISKVTLQNSTHKTTTKAEIDRWVTEVRSKTVNGHRSVRRTVTDRAESWKAAHAAIATNYQLCELELIDARRKIQQLKDENEALRAQLAKCAGSKVIGLTPSARRPGGR